MSSHLATSERPRMPVWAAWACSAVLNVPLPVWADNWLALRLPPRTQDEWVIQNGRINGIPTQVQRLESELGPADLLDFFNREWRSWGGLPKAGEQGGWRTLAVQRDPLNVVLQVQANNDGRSGGSVALLSQMNLRERQSDFVPADLPRLPSTRVTQVTETHDGARRSRLVQLASDAGFELTRQRLRSHWQRLGWRAVHDADNKPAAGTAAAGRHWLAAFEQGNSSVDVVLGQAPGSSQLLLTINLLDTRP